jgi:hypothetical protein
MRTNRENSPAHILAEHRALSLKVQRLATTPCKKTMPIVSSTLFSGVNSAKAVIPLYTHSTDDQLFQNPSNSDQLFESQTNSTCRNQPYENSKLETSSSSENKWNGKCETYGVVDWKLLSSCQRDTFGHHNYRPGQQPVINVDLLRKQHSFRSHNFYFRQSCQEETASC